MILFKNTKTCYCDNLYVWHIHWGPELVIQWDNWIIKDTGLVYKYI